MACYVKKNHSVYNRFAIKTNGKFAIKIYSKIYHCENIYNGAQKLNLPCNILKTMLQES